MQMSSPSRLHLQRDRQHALVFDAVGIGHRANYVRTIAAALNGVGLIGNWRRHAWRLLTSPVVIFSSFETRPVLFAVLAIVRSLILKRTAILLLRAAVADNASGRLKAAIHLGLSMLPRVRLLTIMPEAASPHLRGRIYEIQDPEFWDRSENSDVKVESQLADDMTAKAAGRNIILCTGMITGDKGMDFLLQVMRQSHWPADKFLVCSVGEVMPDAREAVEQIAELGAHVVNRFISETELASIFQRARFAWCCYPPERDMSSGIFGRACQFGCWPLVRSGSVLDSMARAYGVGTALPWGEPDVAASAISLLRPKPFALRQNRSDNVARLMSVIFDHKPEFVDPLNRPAKSKIEVSAECVE